MLIPLGLRVWFRKLLEPLAKALSAAHVSPNTLTVLGFVPAVGSGVAFAKGMVRLGGVLLGVSGLFDLSDGLLARLGNKETSFGALLDSTIDRYSEIAVFIGLAIFYRGENALYGVLLALAGSLMVSYLKARAEGLGYACKTGMLQRPERLVILILGALIGAKVLGWAIWLVALLANITAVERLLRTRSIMGKPND
ncbi:MAG TPA: CDP-alcohol phosphatidyltransferase family protein [bacterium]|nr:CDP-alcohol phosphatidyltransferase family protein [bacterium]